MSALRIVTAGANGRTGRVLVEAVNNHPDTILSDALKHAGFEVLGPDADFTSGIKTGIAISDDVDAALAQNDMLINFTCSELTLKHLQECVEKSVNIIVDTTGFDNVGKAAIRSASEKTGVVFAADFSVGISLTLHVLDTVVRVLNKDYGIEIIEGHYRYKVDVPSGTALRTGEVIADALDRDFKQYAVYNHGGHAGLRDPSTISFAIVHAGDIAGNYAALFVTDSERVEITRRASSRMTFVTDTVRVAV